MSRRVTLPSILLQHQLIRLSQQSGPLLPATILAVDIWNNPQSWPSSKPMRVSETCALVKLLGTELVRSGYKDRASFCQPSENVAPLLSNCKGEGCQNSVPQENIKKQLFFFLSENLFRNIATHLLCQWITMITCFKGYPGSLVSWITPCLHVSASEWVSNKEVELG